jgi:hypothetical protein
MEPVESFDVNTTRGFIKFELKPRDFFHSKFANLYAVNAIKIATKEAGYDKLALPNVPYTPVIRDVYVDYSSKEVIDFTVSDSSYNKLFHVYPFGQKESASSGTNEFLFPQFVSGTEENEGELYIGVSGLAAPQSLSVLFQVAEGSSDPNVCKPEVSWDYLSANNWVKFAGSQILSDTTDGLVNSGIIIFDIPGDITGNGCRLLLAAGKR